MEQENDLILSKLAVRISDTETSALIGSGIIYHAEYLKSKVYILTAAHCLYTDDESFKQPRDQVNVDFYAPSSNSYKTVTHTINHQLIFPDSDKDIAVLIFDKATVEYITGPLPSIVAVKERQSATMFAVKGFPSATHGQELVCIFPSWAQAMTGSERFQLHLGEDYKGWATNGFSGSGVFLHMNNHLYLYGIFTRYREENRGKVIYCQYIDTVNQLLEQNFLPTISFTFLGEHGLTPAFLSAHVKTAVKDLGPRFNERLNFRLPIAQCFHDIAKDSLFKKRLLDCLDKWLMAKNHYRKSVNNKGLDTVEAEYESLREAIRVAIPLFGWSPDQKIDLTTLLAQIHRLNGLIDQLRHELYEKQWEEQKKEKDVKKDYSYRAPYENELSRLREIEETNRQLLSSLDDVSTNLVNFPFLLIDGEAGNGKSHLLGDIATERNKREQPTLLLLGQHFKGGQTVWQNILAQLRLSCTPADLLTALNNIGKQVGSRVLILIDALNEGAGKALWHGELAGFIHEISQYPFIGLVLTVRSTYWNAVVPSTLQNDLSISRLTHEGFKGNEYAALNLFCDFYDLEQPNFPILAPEFTKPLFLRLICEGLKASKQRTFPQGFQGILAIFDFYLKAISHKLADKRDEYRLRTALAEKAIKEVAQACFQQSRTRVLPLDEAVNLFDVTFAKHPYLLDDLILEGVFIQNTYRDYETKKEYEAIYFAYERFGDFIIAKQLLQDYKTPDQVKTAFERGNALGKLVEEDAWSNRGLLEALSVLLPETYCLEITEVYDWVFDSNANDLTWNVDGWLSKFLLDSLKWRTTQSIDNEKLTAWLISERSNLEYDEYLLLLTELTILPDHPFNGDRLHRILKDISMPERDSFWQQHVLYHHETDDNGNGFPIKRLIDWAWQPSISAKIEIETARLTGQTLSWVLASTNRTLRDRTTKAMVNLLEEQPDALISILTAFRDVDDTYITERLYAVAYGCALRTSSIESLLKIAQYVFNAIFKPGNPPNHILLRDYARNTVEYAIYKQLIIEGNINLIRPPYQSRMPEVMPSKEDVHKYKVDSDSPEYKEGYGSTVNTIHFSVMDWDFGDKIVDPALSDFSPVSFTFEKEYKILLKGLKPKVRTQMKLFASYYEWQNRTQSQIQRLIRRFGKELANSLQKDLNEFFVEAESILKDTLNEEQLRFVYDKVVPHLDALKQFKAGNRESFNTLPIRCWIVQRVFDLGFDAKLHGRFDSNRDYFDRHENYIERIGKKYQWIAFHEIMAMVTDNYKLNDGWGSKSQYKYYQGPWQLYLRNIDPVFTATKVDLAEEDTEDELGIVNPSTGWWLDSPYTYWNQPESTWAINIQDLPDPTQIIQRTDEMGQDWLYLKLHVTWKEPKPIGRDRYRTQRKDLWYMFQGYLVSKKNKTKILEWLQTQDFKGRWLPENGSEIGLFNRENYWSPISKANQKERKVWVRFGEANHKVVVATTEAVGEMSEDRSGAHFRYEMPCQTIFEGMGLQYASTDGEFNNKIGEVVVSNANPSGVLIRKNDLVKFLDDNGLDIIWVLLGEKRSYGGDDRSKNNFSTISGVYHLDDNKVTGTFTLRKDKLY